MNSHEKRWLVKHHANQWQDNDVLWYVWEGDFYWSSKRIIIWHSITHLWPLYQRWVRKGDDSYNGTAMAITFNIGMAMAMLILLFIIIALA